MRDHKTAAPASVWPLGTFTGSTPVVTNEMLVNIGSSFRGPRLDHSRCRLHHVAD